VQAQFPGERSAIKFSALPQSLIGIERNAFGFQTIG
jgi:hypothetical protein